MKLELTDQQAQVVTQGRPVEVIDPMSNRAFVLVSRELYESIRSLLGTEDRMASPCESVVPDTDRTYSVHQMAQAWNAISLPASTDEIPLSVDPDDYPLF
jgi:hypothetical protein